VYGGKSAILYAWHLALAIRAQWHGMQFSSVVIYTLRKKTFCSVSRAQKRNPETGQIVFVYKLPIQSITLRFGFGHGLVYIFWFC